jgi:glycosyltransferase involved in cell wall biosynthesis
VVTFTGTDVNEDLASPERAPLVQDVVRRCDALVAFHASIAARVAVACRDATDRLHVIGQAVHCRETRFEIGDRLGIPGQAFVVFQPAGIRRVKNIPSVIPPLSAVQRRHPELRYLLAGPVIEDEEGRRVDEAMRGLTWARYLGALPHEAICAILPQVHVVINSSRSEGGMPNAVLEAMSKAVPVLASDIEGNRSVIEDGRDGLLYRSPTEFAERLERLIADPGLRAALGRRAQEKASRDFRLDGEIGGYLRLYRSLTAARV